MSGRSGPPRRGRTACDERGTSTALPTPSLRRMTPTLAAGEVIAERYRITRLIGRGGMGEVYEAHDLLLEEDVAVKTLARTWPVTRASCSDFRRRFSLARKVTHPNVCRIFEVGIHHGRGGIAGSVLRDGAARRRDAGRPHPRRDGYTRARPSRSRCSSPKACTRRIAPASSMPTSRAPT